MWGRYGVKEGNVDEQSVVEFAKRMEMAGVNTYFKKRKEHRVERVRVKKGNHSWDYLLCRRCNLKKIARWCQGRV